MRFSLFLRAQGLFARAAPQAADRRVRGTALALAVILALAVVTVAGCNRMKPTDTRPLDQAGMWFRSIEELKELAITDAEVAQLAKARQAGVTDAACIELVRVARQHHQEFASGDAIAGLRRVEVTETTILELARLNQIGLWAGEAQAMRLAGLSDQILLGVARRRAAGQKALSGPLLARLKNAGQSEADLLNFIERGTTDEQAEQMLAAHQRAMTPSGFIRQRGRRR